MPSSDEPHEETPGESFRERRESSGPISTPAADDTRTGIIRRHPTGPIPQPLSDDTRTGILRRRPAEVAGVAGTADSDDATRIVKPLREPETGIIKAPPRRIGENRRPLSNVTAVAASALAILSGWATSVVATSLITGWWRTDRLFCVGVGFLTAVFAATTIAGVVGLLLRRRVGIYLTLVGAVLALLIFAGIFVAGAHMAGVVRAIPVLPAATAVLTLARPTWRWTALAG